ncbi:FUT1_2 [Mytilus coruscus]|uniref:L-Fucosyltransferase n=1 Tax=Mytilus coruscus TaxID=42192 RepID=A0A6J8DQF0_MYTCO|nr:FUT1_2 [Mytilus coruscus]
MTLLLNSHDEINTIFKLNVTKLRSTKRICSKSFLIQERIPCTYDSEILNFDRRKVVKLKGFQQSWKYFIKYEEENLIRKQFVFERLIRDQAQEIIDSHINKYKSKNDPHRHLTIVGVHIRRGDYLRPDNKELGYNVAPMSYIEKALALFRKKFIHCVFLVFTCTSPNKNDKKWLEKNVKGPDVIKVGTNERDVDMCALSQCNHTIITVGTFGWWAAWLSNGTTVYYKNVAVQNSKLRQYFSKDMLDFFPSQWIGL